MKKLLIMAAVAGLALASCTNDNEEAYVSNNEPQRITFASPVMYGITRANMVDTIQGGKDQDGHHVAYSKKETFRVFGATYASTGETTVDWTNNSIYNEGNVDGAGEEAFYNNTLFGWDTATPHFWDDNLLYAFAAYSPADISSDGTANYGAGGLQITSYTTPAMGEQYDLMYAEAVYGQNKSKMESGHDGTGGEVSNEFYNGVNLVFKHALANVNFKVGLHPSYLQYLKGKGSKLADEAKKFEIKNITITGVSDLGNFDEHAKTNGLEGMAMAYQTDESFIQTAQPTGYDFWTGQKTDAGDLKSVSYEFVDQTSPIILTYATDDETKTSDQIARDLQSFNLPADGLKVPVQNKVQHHVGFMIPQGLTENAKITIEWAYGEEGSRLDKNPIVIYLNGKDMNPITESWKMGYRYTYTIMFALDRIYFAPSINAWNDTDAPAEPNAPIVIGY